MVAREVCLAGAVQEHHTKTYRIMSFVLKSIFE